LFRPELYLDLSFPFASASLGASLSPGVFPSFLIVFFSSCGWFFTLFCLVVFHLAFPLNDFEDVHVLSFCF